MTGNVQTGLPRKWLVGVKIALMAMALLVVVPATADQVATTAPSDANPLRGPVCVATCLQKGATLNACAAKCDATALDQRCLRDCVSQGNGGNKCRSSCTYIRQDQLTQANKAPGGNVHSQFSTLVPVTPDFVLPDQTQKGPAGTPQLFLHPNQQPLSPSTDYKCQSTCRQAGYSEGYCKQGCSY